MSLQVVAQQKSRVHRPAFSSESTYKPPQTLGEHLASAQSLKTQWRSIALKSALPRARLRCNSAPLQASEIMRDIWREFGEFHFERHDLHLHIEAGQMLVIDLRE